MAAQAIAGVEGNFAMENHNGRISSWTYTSAQDVNDASGFGLTSNWRDVLPGMRGWRVEAAGFLLRNAASTAPHADFTGTDDGAIPAGTSITLTLANSTSGTCTITGSVVPASFQIGDGINGNATYSLTAVGAGAPTESWDEA